jgi:hypothetical protein
MMNDDKPIRWGYFVLGIILSVLSLFWMIFDPLGGIIFFIISIFVYKKSNLSLGYLFLGLLVIFDDLFSN